MMRVESARSFIGAVKGSPATGEVGTAERLPVKVELRLAANRELYREGQRAAAPYLVVEGIMRVSVGLIDGRERLIDLVGPGDVVGAAAFEAARHSETVIAAEGGAVVAQLDLERAMANRFTRRELTAALVRQLVRSRELADDLGLPMGARICRILARLALRLGYAEGASAIPYDSQESWCHLPFTLTHDDVALLAGCARVTATRIMGDLKEAGVLHGGRGDYSLVPAALLRAADEYVCDVI